jgi:hypothetical protein
MSPAEVSEPIAMSSGERLSRVSEILAAGILRLRDRVALTAEHGPTLPTQNVQNSVRACLDVPSETSVTVHTG